MRPREPLSYFRLAFDAADAHEEWQTGTRKVSRKAALLIAIADTVTPQFSNAQGFNCNWDVLIALSVIVYMGLIQN